MITKEMFYSLSKSKREELSKRTKEVRDSIHYFKFTSVMISVFGYFIVLLLIVLPLWKIAFGSVSMFNNSIMDF